LNICPAPFSAGELTAYAQKSPRIIIIIRGDLNLPAKSFGLHRHKSRTALRARRAALRRAYARSVRGIFAENKGFRRKYPGLFTPAGVNSARLYALIRLFFLKSRFVCSLSPRIIIIIRGDLFIRPVFLFISF
jgi:hypothetical protein